MNSYTYDQAGLTLTESSEGCPLEAYWDATGGCWTIGWGHTGKDVYRALIITRAQAEILLRSDLQAAAHCVNSACEVIITQGEFDGLVDFAFNVGRGNFLKSDLLKFVNANEFDKAAAEFSKWTKSGGQVLPGLVTRRKKEVILFKGDAR